MEEKFIKGAAQLYYKENVEGEPLNQDTPIECFVAGAKFIIGAMKKHQNICNNSHYSSYSLKKSNMNDTAKFKKIVENIEKINKVTGFYITALGDPSVGINPATWELKNDFYFDNQEELEIFRGEIKSLFEFYCGEVTHVITFEEHQKMIENEELRYFEEFPVRYLIRDKGYIDNMYKKAGCTGMYSPNVGTAIHTEVPDWIPENWDYDTEIIKSTDPKFKQILLDEANRLEHQIENDEMSLKNAKLNLDLIRKELKFGQK